MKRTSFYCRGVGEVRRRADPAPNRTATLPLENRERTPRADRDRTVAHPSQTLFGAVAFWTGFLLHLAELRREMSGTVERASPVCVAALLRQYLRDRELHFAFLPPSLPLL